MNILKRSIEQIVALLPQQGQESKALIKGVTLMQTNAQCNNKEGRD